MKNSHYNVKDDEHEDVCGKGEKVKEDGCLYK
jgi:hypothetical protein